MSTIRSIRPALRWVVAACAAALLAGFAWWFRHIHDESLTIEPGSIAYRLLVPDELKQERLAAFGKVRQYEYGAADGPKPTITLVWIDTKGPSAMSIQEITDAYIAIGFSVSEPGRLVRGKTELEISGDAACQDNCRVTLALSQHW